MTRRLAAGAGLVVAYLAVVLAISAVSHRRIRPLFEGIGPPAPYRWVKPPPEFAATNVAPTVSMQEIALGPAGSELTAVQSSEGQVVVNLAAGTIPARPGATGVLATITPLDPGTLGRVPAGLVADGNAYRVELVYRPSREPVTSLGANGNIVMTVPQHGVAVLHSADGRTWTRLQTEQLGGASTLGSSFAGTGLYLGAATRTRTPAKNGASDTARTLLVAAVVAVLAAGLGLAPWLFRRQRAASTRQRPAGPSPKGRPPARRAQQRSRRRR